MKTNEAEREMEKKQTLCSQRVGDLISQEGKILTFHACLSFDYYTGLEICFSAPRVFQWSTISSRHFTARENKNIKSSVRFHPVVR